MTVTVVFLKVNGQVIDTAILKLTKDTCFQLFNTVLESHELCLLSACHKIEKNNIKTKYYLG